MGMMNNKTVRDINIAEIQRLPTPAQYEFDIPISDEQKNFIYRGREAINNVLSGNDNRFMVIVGPCSIHDTAAGADYAARLRDLAKTIDSKILVVMRVYFEKPRTTVG